MMEAQGSTTEAIFGPEKRSLTIATLATIAIVAYNNLALSSALPEIGNDLGDVALLPWTISVELLTSGVAILAAGPLVDGIGVRRMFRISVTGFIATSVLCASAPTMTWLILGRGLQGIAAGTVLTVAMATIGISYSTTSRARVFAANSTVWGITSVAGPSIAATMVAVVGWRGVFAFNVPVALLAASLAWRVLPDRASDSKGARFDAVGIVLITLLSAAGLTIVQGHLATIAVGVMITVAAMAAFRAHSRVSPHPLVRLDHVFSARYRPIHLTSMLALTAALAANAYLAVYLKGARGLSTTAAAFSVVYISIGWTTGAIVSSRLQARFAVEKVVLAGTLVMTPFFFAFAGAVAIGAPVWAIYATLIGVGLGVGTVSTTGANLLQDRAPMAEMGRLSGAHQFVRTLGVTYGVGLSGAIVLTTVRQRTGDVEAVRELLGSDSNAADSSLAAGSAVADALGDGYAIALAVSAVLVALSVPSAIRLVRSRDQVLTSAP